MSSYNEVAQQKVQEFIGGLPEDVQHTVLGAMQRLLESDVASQARSVGDAAPDFSLPNASGGQTRLSELVARGPVVLSFYRGGWCPFCNLEFKALHDRLDEFKQLGATLLGVAPETLPNTIQTARDHNLQFEVCSDEGNLVAREYGLVMTVDEAIRPHYLEWGIDLVRANGDERFELPVPATYIIDSNGIIRAAHVNKDYTKRMEPTAIVAALHAL